MKLVNSMHKKPIKTEFFHWVRNQDAERANHPKVPSSSRATDDNRKAWKICSRYQYIKHLSGDQGG